MNIRWHCMAFAAMSGLTFSFLGFNIWSATFLCLALMPYLKSLKTAGNMAVLFLLAATTIFFYVYGIHFVGQSETNLTGDETIFEGSVKTDPKLTRSERQWSFQVELKNQETVQLFYEYDPDFSPPGLFDSCSFKGELSVPSRARNPYAFDYSRYLYEQGIHWIIEVEKENLICEQVSNPWLMQLRNWRNDGISGLGAIEGEHTAALMTALVFGDRTYMPEDKMDYYRQLGILHLLAVSGLHVGLVTMGMFYLLYRCGVTRETAALTVFCMLPVYMFIAGGAPSVIRASLSCMLILLTVRFRWKVKSVDILSLVCMGLLLVNPFYLFHLGFQLSFLTSFALLMSKRIFTDSSRLKIVAKVTIIAQLISLPLTLYHFYEFSLFMLPANILFVPFVSLWVLPMSFFTVIFQWVFPPLAELSYSLVSYSLNIMDYVLVKVSQIPWGTIVLGRPAEGVVWLMMGTIIAAKVLFETKKTAKRAAGSALVVSVIAFHALQPYFNSNASVTVLYVGQGEAIVIELPHRKGVYLIDTGGVYPWGDEASERDPGASTGPGKYAIEPFLKGKGIGTIDKLILTHGDFDHVGEVCYLSDRFNITSSYYPLASSFPDEAKRSLSCLADEGVPVNQVRRADSWQVGNDWFYILHPEGGETEENNRSIVLLASLNDVTFLFTGDLEEEGEITLISNYPHLTADVLNAGHHGSATSTNEAFLDQVAPDTVLISSGENNRFNHPHPEVIERLGERDIAVYRTDRHGAVELVVRDGEYEVAVTVEEQPSGQ